MAVELYPHQEKAVSELGVMRLVTTFSVRAKGVTKIPLDMKWSERYDRASRMV